MLVLSKNRLLYNAAFYLADMVLFTLAMGFLDSSTVLPDFVGQATDSKVLVGVTGILFAVGWRLPQLALAPAVNHAKSKRAWMFWTCLPGRLVFFVVAAIIAAIGTRSPGLMLLVFFVAYTLFAMSDGITSLAWVELIGNAVSERARGLMFGISQVIAGVSILVIQQLLRELLGPHGPGYPINFAVVFAIAGGLLALTLPFVANLYERPTETKPRAIEATDYLPYLAKIVRNDHGFRQFLIMRFFLEVAYYMVVPFYIGFETQAFGIPAAQAVGDSLVAVTLGNIGGSLLAGWLSHRFTSRTAIRLQSAAILIGPTLALLSPLIGPGALLISFAMIGLSGALSTPGLFNWLISYPPLEERPLYFGVANTLGATALLAPVIGGVLLQATSYNALFGLTVGIALIAAFTALQLNAPRQPGTEAA